MLPCRSRILFNLDCWNSCLRLCSNHLLNINGNIHPNVRAKFSTKVYIVSQLNADKVKDELEKFYPNDVAFELVPISKAKEGTFMRDLWLEQEDLEKLNDAEIILCDNMFIPQILTSCSKLKWIQGAYAGVDTVFRRLPKFFKSGEYPSIPVTRFSGKSFGKLISQYCLGYIIAVERNFIKFRDNQHTRDWSILLSQQSGLIYRSLDEITVTVLGFGPIGKDMCKCFSSLGCKVTAFARNPKTKEDLESFGATTFTTNLSDALSNTDYIVAILPDTPDTIGLLNGNVLSVCSAKKPTLINVGRGSLISSVDVIKALDNEWISNAVLDVFEVEPLPADNPLWTHPKVIITPHISAKAQPKDLAEIFRDNFEHFKKGEPLELQIDWKSGY